MNGAQSLVETLVGGGVNVCFTNPGTSEMHFVAALDRVDGMRSILGLFEGVVTGAADGYARMADRPAATLLHLGPGLANGAANLHNARKAMSPMVNIVGEHATYHIAHDAPLTADVEGRQQGGRIRRNLFTPSRIDAASMHEGLAAVLCSASKRSCLCRRRDRPLSRGAPLRS